jgi:hypothetical protein
VALGGNVYHAGDHVEAEKQVLNFAARPEWFLTVPRRVSGTEYIAYLYRLGVRPRMLARQAKEFFLAVIPLPGRPQDLPEEDQGIRLSLNVRPADEPGLLLFTLRLKAGPRSAWREVEHRYTNTLPFLFAFYDEGQAVTVPVEGFARLGGINQATELVPAYGERAWELKVDEPSMRRLLSSPLGATPRRLSITAVFSERQHQPDTLSDVPSDWKGDDLKLPSRQVLVRSNTATLLWTGSRWLADGQ